ncbi:hypothetical protein V8E36_006546 [Tilletia maclaganii]
MADLKYVEAWKKQSTATRASSTSSTKTQAYNVRLDLPTGDGLSYAPDALASGHNTTKRLFLPAPISLASPGGYDFAAEIAARKREKEANFKLGDYDGDEDDAEEEEDDGYRFETESMLAPSIRSHTPLARLNSDNASLNSTTTFRSTLTASQLASASKKQILPTPPPHAVSNRLPPSISGTSAQTPWTAPLRTNPAALDRLSTAERESGKPNRWEEMNERGNVPVEALQQLAENRSPPLEGDGASVFSDVASIRTTATTAGAETLSVESLFVADPRPWRPLRYVRRTEPTQLLLLSHGLLIRNPATGSLTGGIGVEYCPPSTSTKRQEKNLSHALERPPDPILLQSPEPTTKRAALRAAIAALEYADWYEEGFDQIVVGVAHDWLVRGICSDIWAWQQTGWVVSSAAGADLGVDPGERVPDRDLWELLDEVVRAYEKIDCNVRFWRVNKADLDVAKELAVNGAMKDKVQPETVRWRKKPRGIPVA